MGGNSTRAIRRAVEMCEGWCPFRTTVDTSRTRTAPLASIGELRDRVALVRRLCEETGRTEPLDICFSGALAGGRDVPAARQRDELEELGEAGVTWVSVGFDTFEHAGAATTRRAVIDRARRYADEVLAPLR
jgi:hypothetical protein